MIVLVGYAALALNVGGNMLLAHKNIWGWVVRLATNAAWIAYAVQVDDGEPVALNHAVFLCINVYGLCRWRRGEDS